MDWLGFFGNMSSKLAPTGLRDCGDCKLAHRFCPNLPDIVVVETQVALAVAVAAGWVPEMVAGIPPMVARQPVNNKKKSS